MLTADANPQTTKGPAQKLKVMLGHFRDEHQMYSSKFVHRNRNAEKMALDLL